VRMPAVLQTRVARRFFALFVLAAFLPLALVGALSLTQLRDLMLQQGDQRLAATAKTYGMGIFERLLGATEVAAGVAGGEAGADSAMAQRNFRSLALLSGGRITQLMGEPLALELGEAQLRRLASGKPVAIVRAEASRARVFVAAPSRKGDGRAVVGEVRTRYLWGPSDELPAGTEFCTLEDVTRTVMFCQAPGGEGALRAYAARASETSATQTWERDGEVHRARSWAQFMGAAFGTADWIVVASQTEQAQLGRMLEYRRIYVPVVILALLLVTWFTFRQARNIVEPVGSLARRARSMAQGDFDERLRMKRDDEFGELADAFDRMSHRLGRQFASLKALSQIDGLILTTQDTAQVIRTVLQRLAQMVPADSTTLSIFERDQGDHARTYYMSAGPEGAFMMDRQRMDESTRAQLEQDPEGRWLDLATAAQGLTYLTHARSGGMRGALVQPIVWRGVPCGVLVLAYREAANPDEEDMARVREIADRVAVAVSSAWRDEQLYQQAHYDPLTGAPNRMLFKDRLGIEIARSHREGYRFALLFIDLDHFKSVNDSFGHAAGDIVLREAATRISQCLRASDTVSRQGGDEFTVLVTNIQHAEEAWLIAEAIVAALSREFMVGDQRCFLSASVGIASYPIDGTNAEVLLKSADTAMYRAKAGGRAQVVFYEEKMNTEALTRLTLDRDLRVAIQRGELEMHYQPQLDLRTGLIRGAEALLRWRHPTKGLISPVRFIPLAEESGFIEQLGQWTIARVCEQMGRWRAEGIVLEQVAVNFSPRQFRRRNVVDQVAHCIAEARIPASCLEIEITEGLLLDRGEAVEGALRDLASAGHLIALDDFGTGFSSMSYLKRLPVNTLKIDRVFIDGMEQGSDAEAIVAAIIAMAHALGKTVIAEGVETDQQAEVLRRLRCDEIQGFLVSPALPAQQFAAFVRSFRQSDSPRAAALHE